MNFSALDRYLDSLYVRKNIPGCGVTVYRKGELLHSFCAGFAVVEERKPFAEDTVFNLYSATKISTCTAGMRMAERGELDPDAPVSDYLPEFAGIRVAQPDGSSVPAENRMLIRHLFTMTAGFSYSSDVPSVRKMRERNPEPTTREFVRALAEEPLGFEPGSHFRYSFCHDVLAAVLEEIRGIPFSEVLRQEIFEPLGMKDTAFRLNEEQRTRLAPEYHGFNGTTGRARHTAYREGMDMGLGSRYESGGGGLMSCIRDYGKLAATLANGGVSPDGVRLLNEESIDRMRQNQLNREAMKDFEAMGGWSKAGYGYGFGVRTLIDRERNNSLSENGEFGWDGALGCYVLADPSSGIGLFYAQQEGGSPWWTWHGTVRNLVYAAILGAES